MKYVRSINIIEIGEDMSNDLKIIKKYYGEKMSKLCRKLFPTILETEGLLSTLLLDHFEPNHFLYDDIIKQDRKVDFQNYIYSFIGEKEYLKDAIQVEKTPEELLDEAGYILYQCNNDEEIESFRKYYEADEELCTFDEDRLGSCYVFFAVKKNVDDIKRENFPHPKRQDEYGTSVISIQFERDDSHNLSIKNRYNHAVENPDSTFSNNLDNIIPGLTDSFAKYYGLIQSCYELQFELDGYVRANDGKLYKYNLDICDVYYCPDNIIIDNLEVKRYDKERYIIFDYFILDLKKKTISLYDNFDDAFLDTVQEIDRIEIKKENHGKKVILTQKDDNKIELVLDDTNQLVKLKNDKVEKIGNDFLGENSSLIEVILPNVTEIGAQFLYSNQVLKKIELPNARKIESYFLYYNKALEEIYLPNVIEIGDQCLYFNKYLKRAGLPSAKKVGNHFLYSNESLITIQLQNVIEIGHYFLYVNKDLEMLELPNVKEIGFCCLYFNEKLKYKNIADDAEVGAGFLFMSQYLNEESFMSSYELEEESHKTKQKRKWVWL